MRKALIIIISILALTGCKEKYERVIDSYLEDHLKDPESYQNIEIGKPGIITPMSRAFVECVSRAKAGEFPMDSINTKLEQIKTHFQNKGIDPYDTLGWEVTHKYRAKNSFGATDLVEVVYTFDKEMNNIIESRQK